MGDIGKYFNKSEFACKCGCGKDNISPKLVKILDTLREAIGHKLDITSGVRCEKHNAKEKGTSGSAHVDGLAADIVVHDARERHDLILFIIQQGIVRYGIANTFIHIDIDDSKPQDVVWVYK